MSIYRYRAVAGPIALQPQPTDIDSALRVLRAAREECEMSKYKGNLDTVGELRRVANTSRSAKVLRAANRIEKLETGFWITNEGEEIAIKDMEDRHLENAIRWCQRNPDKIGAIALPALKEELVRRTAKNLERSPQ